MLGGMEGAGRDRGTPSCLSGLMQSPNVLQKRDELVREEHRLSTCSQANVLLQCMRHSA